MRVCCLHLPFVMGLKKQQNTRGQAFSELRFLWPPLTPMDVVTGAMVASWAVPSPAYNILSDFSVRAQGRCTSRYHAEVEAYLALFCYYLRLCTTFQHYSNVGDFSSTGKFLDLLLRQSQPVAPLWFLSSCGSSLSPGVGQHTQTCPWFHCRMCQGQKLCSHWRDI